MKKRKKVGKARALAHKISGPLTGVLGYSQLLLELTGRDDPMRLDMLELEKAALRCRAILDDFLGISKERKNKSKKGRRP